eukprot:5483339-Prymnesium_polylepis.1
MIAPRHPIAPVTPPARCPYTRHRHGSSTRSKHDLTRYPIRLRPHMHACWQRAEGPPLSRFAATNSLELMLGGCSHTACA